MATKNAWENEPESLDFKAHGLQCAMRRGPFGHWCGYVAVPSGHPLHGRDYSAKVKAPKHVLERTIDRDKISVISLVCQSIGADEATEDGYYSVDLLLDAHGGITYAKDHEPTAKPDGQWWFGFDCAHSGDLLPDHKRAYGEEGVYRDQAYVENECRSLAKQLAEWSHG